MQDLATRVRTIIAKQLCVPAERVTDDARWAEDLGADDLERVEVVMRLEEEFDLDIDDAAIETFATPGDMLRYIAQRVRA